MGRKRAFTLIELLVVIAVIAVLMSILVPALSRAREQARQVMCLTRLKAIGTGVTMYAQQYADRLPPPEYLKGGPEGNGFNDVYWAFWCYTDWQNPTPAHNLALLVETRMIDGPKSLYCPGQRPGVFGGTGLSFAWEEYNDDGLWPYNAGTSGYHVNQVRSSYLYVPRSKSRKLAAAPQYNDLTEKLADLDDTQVMASDVLYTIETLPHKSGNKARGISALYGDTHAEYVTDESAFTSQFWGDAQAGTTPANRGLSLFGLLETMRQ